MTIWGWVVANWEILSAVLDGTNTTKKTTTQTSGDTYAAGDSLDVEVTNCELDAYDRGCGCLAGSRGDMT